jgi:TonB-linked SusC/RagA family outer membrane protein
MKKLLQSLFLLLFLAFQAMAQERTVTGTVTDKTDGLPLPGVSVKVKGTNIGTSTGGDGRFSVRVPQGSTALILTYIGYSTQEASIGSNGVVNVQLTTDAKQLSEVIVTGVAGATTKEKLTVSVTKVSEERLNAVTGTSLAGALSGKVAGIKASGSSGAPGSGVDIQLRADNNLNNVGSGPLILVDGVIYTGSLADINADDVSSMEVVKGAAASALYGSRAGNGVIAVTTKRGNSIALNTVKVNVRNEVGVQEIARTLDLSTHHPFQLAADYQQFAGIFTKYQGVTYPAGYRDAGHSPLISGNRVPKADHYMDNPYGVTRNQQDDFFNRGVNYANFVSMTSRTEKTGVYASFENNSQQGVIEMTDGYKRQNFRFNVDQQIAPWLKFSTSNLLVNTNTEYPGSSGNIFFNVALAEPDVNMNQVNPDGQPYYLRMNHWSGETVNPLYPLYKVQRKDKKFNWIGNFALNARVTSWANFDVSHSMERSNYRYRNYSPKDTWTPTGGTAATNGMSYTNGSLQDYSDEGNSQNTQATLNMVKDLGDLTVRGKLSYLYENRRYENYEVSSSQLGVAGIPTYDNFAVINDAESLNETERAQNYFAILGLDYKDKLLFDGMYRYDGSSLFGSAERWNPYFRLSGAYRISEDVKIPGIDELKIRAAYGTAGIRPGFAWQYETFTLNNGSATAVQRGNQNLKPSKTAETEIGLNVDFLKKFSFEAVYAQSTTDDQFLNVPLLGFLNNGFTRQFRNAGSVDSKTLEFSLGANWVNKKDFSWSSNIVFSRIRQKITDLPISPYVFGDTDGGGQQMFYIAGNESYGSMYGHTWVKSLDQMSKQLPAGRTIADYEINSAGYVIAKGTQGTITEKAIKQLDDKGAIMFGKIGDGNADFNMGFANTLNFKRATFYFLLDLKKGGDIYNAKGQWLTRDLRNPEMDMSGVAQGDKKAYDYFLNFYDVNTPNSYWVEDGTYLKLREVALGYTFPLKSLNLLGGVVKSITAKVVGRNLLTFTGYSGYDPEVGTLRQPYDGTYKYPNFRNYAFSLSMDF